jgi:hypothetical protein
MHYLLPGVIAFYFFKENWKNVWLILILTNLVDLDHLLSTPIFSPTRCSINYHILHSYFSIAIYLAALFFKKTRIIAIGLLLHMLTDAIDCCWIR